MEQVLENGTSGAVRPHILAIPYPLIGHMTPIVQLCKMLIAKAGCRVTIACSERQVLTVCRLLPDQHEQHHMKVLAILDSLPAELADVHSWDNYHNLIRSHQEALPCSFALHIQSFSDVVCVIADTYLSWTQDVADQLGAPRLAVWGSAAAEYQVPATENGEKYPECLKWLDGQKPRSVIYVAFGTFIHLAKAEVRELALGLLHFGQPFIWVYPNPSKDTVEGWRPELPEGFLDELSKGRGLVLEWAPQKHVLNHPSIGGFLTHCGWNSTMETICSGVPTLGLPYICDQSLNCKMMVEEWKVGLRLERSPGEGIATAEEISWLIQELLVGEKGNQLHKRAQELKIAAKSSIQPGGSSHLMLDAILKLIK